jgi:DNA-binding transcriptional LysR family regulator
MITDHFAEQYVRTGELVQVLADWALPTISASAVFPGRRLMPARTRVFLDMLQAEFTGPRCQKAEAQIVERKGKR